MTTSREQAEYCIQAMKENKTFRGEKIGIVVKDIPGIWSRKKGAIVIYKREYEYCPYGIEDKKLGNTVTVGSPYPKNWIEENRKKNNLITTGSTMVGVPMDYVADINNKLKFISGNN